VVFPGKGGVQLMLFWLFFHPPKRRRLAIGSGSPPQNMHEEGGGFEYFVFSSLLGEMIQFDEHIF